MRRRPSVATVLAALALFVSLSGTALAASVIITKNSQVAPHVIAGADAPTGDKQNLVLGSVGTADLHGGAVTKGKIAADAVVSAKVADGALTGDDIADGTLTGSDIADATVGASDLEFSSIRTALKLIHVLRSALPGNQPTMYASGPWTLTGECIDDGGGLVHARVVLSTGVDSILSVNADTGAEFSTEATIAQTPSSGTVAVRGGDFTAQGTFSEPFITGRVMAWTFGSSCSFRFDGTSGP